MPMFTVWVMQDNREGTCHISSHEAATAEAASVEAINETAADWEWDPSDLIVLGIAKGDVEIVEWNDAD